MVSGGTSPSSSGDDGGVDPIDEGTGLADHPDPLLLGRVIARVFGPDQQVGAVEGHPLPVGGGLCEAGVGRHREPAGGDDGVVTVAEATGVGGDLEDLGGVAVEEEQAGAVEDRVLDIGRRPRDRPTMGSTEMKPSSVPPN